MKSAIAMKKRKFLNFLVKKKILTRYDDGLRTRIFDLLNDRRSWYDWGHRLMILTGRCSGGSWDEPKPPTWWYIRGEAKRMFKTNYPRHPESTYIVITDYNEFREKTDGLTEDELYPWKAIYFDSDGELQLGKRYWGNNFHGLSHWDVPILRKYLRMARRYNWYGLRPWLYSLGLYGAVNQKIPFRCQVLPEKGTGGYDHWYCQNKRRHVGKHRYNNYTWGPVGLPEEAMDAIAEHKPKNWIIL